MSSPHRTSIQIRFKDIDKLGHVNNANHLTYLETASVAFVKDVVGHIDWSEKGMILASLTIDYKQPILLEDDIVVDTWCTKIGTKSFELGYLIIKKENGEGTILATATTVLVCMNYRTRETIAIPPDWKTKLGTKLLK